MLTILCFLARTEADARPLVVLVGIGACMVSLTLSMALLNPIYILSSEMLPSKFKVVGQGLGTAVNFSMVGLVSLTFPVLLSSIGEMTFLVFAAICVTAAIYVYIFVPETNNLNSKYIMEKVRNNRLRRKSSVLEAKQTMKTLARRVSMMPSKIDEKVDIMSPFKRQPFGPSWDA